jgi:hypothetical protein
MSLNARLAQLVCTIVRLSVCLELLAEHFLCILGSCGSLDYDDRFLLGLLRASEDRHRGVGVRRCLKRFCTRFWRPAPTVQWVPHKDRPCIKDGRPSVIEPLFP